MAKCSLQPTWLELQSLALSQVCQCWWVAHSDCRISNFNFWCNCWFAVLKLMVLKFDVVLTKQLKAMCKSFSMQQFWDSKEVNSQNAAHGILCLPTTQCFNSSCLDFQSCWCLGFRSKTHNLPFGKNSFLNHQFFLCFLSWWSNVWCAFKEMLTTKATANSASETHHGQSPRLLTTMFSTVSMDSIWWWMHDSSQCLFGEVLERRSIVHLWQDLTETMMTPLCTPLCWTPKNTRKKAHASSWQPKKMLNDFSSTGQMRFHNANLCQHKWSSCWLIWCAHHNSKCDPPRCCLMLSVEDVSFCCKHPSKHFFNSLSNRLWWCFHALLCQAKPTVCCDLLHWPPPKTFKVFSYFLSCMVKTWKIDWFLFCPIFDKITKMRMTIWTMLMSFILGMVSSDLCLMKTEKTFDFPRKTWKIRFQINHISERSNASLPLFSKKGC